MIKTIASSDNIKALELYYICTVDFQMAQDLHVCLIQKQSLKAICLYNWDKPHPRRILELILLIMTNSYR